MNKVILAFALGLGLLLFAGNALAASSLIMNEKATLSDNKTSVVVTGTIVCSLGNFAFVNVSVLQASGQTETLGFGSDSFICTGQVQNWAVQVNVLVGEAFKSGPAIAANSSTDCTGDPSVPPDEDEDPVTCTSVPSSVHGIKIQK